MQETKRWEEPRRLGQREKEKKSFSGKVRRCEESRRVLKSFLAAADQSQR